MSLVTEIQKLRERVEKLASAFEANRSLIDRHEEQINGVRGLSSAIDALAREVKEDTANLSEEVKSMRRAMWAVGGGIVLSAVGFAITVLSVFGA